MSPLTIWVIIPTTNVSIKENTNRTIENITDNTIQDITNIKYIKGINVTIKAA